MSTGTGIEYEEFRQIADPGPGPTTTDRLWLDSTSKALTLRKQGDLYRVGFTKLPTSSWIAPRVPAEGNGTEGQPFTTLALAIAEIPASTQPTQEDTYNLLMLSKNLSSGFNENVTVPSRRNVAFVGTSAFEFIHGSMTWTNSYAALNGDSFLLIEDVALSGSLTVADTAGPGTGATFVVISMARFTSLIGDGNIQGNFDASGASRFGSLSLVGGNIRGSCNCPFGSIFAANGFIGGLLTCALVVANGTTFGASIVMNGSLDLVGCRFSAANPTITGTGTITMDGSTYASFVKQGGTITGPTITLRETSPRKRTQYSLAADVTLAAGSGETSLLGQKTFTVTTPGVTRLTAQIAGRSTTAGTVALIRLLVDSAELTGTKHYIPEVIITAGQYDCTYHMSIDVTLTAGNHTVDLGVIPNAFGVGNFVCNALSDASTWARLLIEEVLAPAA